MQNCVFVCVCVCVWRGVGLEGGQTLHRPSHGELHLKQFLRITYLETSELKVSIRVLNALWALFVYPISGDKNQMVHTNTPR